MKHNEQKVDVLRPPLIWLSGRCYRVYSNEEFSPVSREDEEEELDIVVCNDEPCDMDIKVDKLGNGQFRTRVKVATFFYKNIIGPKGATKKRIEFETKVRIQIPPYGTDGDIVILGMSKNNLCSAKLRIEQIVDSARQRQPFTHFLSIPFTAIQPSFLNFRERVLKECGDVRGVDESIFQNENKMHLTIGTLTLMDQEERKRAVAVLNECSKFIETVIDDVSLDVKVEGIEYMNDDPAEVDVLYAKIIDETNKLQMLADQLIEHFVEESLMQRQYDKVKLHVTIMNSLFRKGVFDTTPRAHDTNRETFNATPILELFRDFNFGTVTLNAVHLSQRHSASRSGYYSSSCQLNLKKSKS